MALVPALGIILCLTLLIAAVQQMSVQQLASFKARSNSQRALELAQIGANAYLFQLSSSFNTSLPWLPPSNPVDQASPAWPVDHATFRQRAGKDAQFPVRNYPAGTPGQGFVVGHRTEAGGVVVFSYGFCNGAVRMIRVTAVIFSPFEFAAAFGLDPYSPDMPGPGGDTGPAWTFTGSAKIVGASGSEGLVNNSPWVEWYDGPLYLTGRGNELNPTLDPAGLVSGPDVPPGHVGTGKLASPFVRRMSRSLNIPTVDEAAKQYVSKRWQINNTVGVRWFASNNNNATGIRYLVRNKTVGHPHFGKVRHLDSGPSLGTQANPVLNLGQVSGNTLAQAGMTADEEFYGVRVYPGNYFFTRVNQPSSQGATLYLRSYPDGGAGVDMSGDALVVYGDANYSTVAVNPNPNSAFEREIRFWVGDVTTGNNSQTQLSNNIWMEYRQYPSRFRILFGNQAGCAISGDSQKKFTVNMLAYNIYRPTSGQNQGIAIPTGSVTLASNTYLYGSLVCWQLDVRGGATIERQALMEQSPYEVMAYSVMDWREFR